MNKDIPDKGFTVTRFVTPYPVMAFHDSSDFHPTPGMAIGLEKCNTFGTERLIVKYDTPPLYARAQTSKSFGPVEWFTFGNATYLDGKHEQ